ncbi:MAG: nucleotidyltransferase domain-containing protein [Bacteroidetes bacterium]|nr:nucleotidyltransferase domain-containing protein [Bacteroidota bacterium]
MNLVKMDNFGEKIRKMRESASLPLRTVAAFLDIDQAILSKVERGQRKASRSQVIKLAKYFKANEDDLLVAWLSDKLVYEVGDEKIAIKAIKVAEEKVAYITFKKTDRKKIIQQLKNGISKFKNIQKAWIYGSFARGDDNFQSDIDIAFKTDEEFSYFDLAEIQNDLECAVNRKVDVGFIDSFKDFILENIKPDLKLIYER